MDSRVAFIGFGEAGRALAVPGAAAYDRKTAAPATRTAMLAAYAETEELFPSADFLTTEG